MFLSKRHYANVEFYLIFTKQLLFRSVAKRSYKAEMISLLKICLKPYSNIKLWVWLLNAFLGQLSSCVRIITLKQSGNINWNNKQLCFGYIRDIWRIQSVYRISLLINIGRYLNKAIPYKLSNVEIVVKKMLNSKNMESTNESKPFSLPNSLWKSVKK